MLTGWSIDIITEADDVARRAEENAIRCNLFMDALDVDDMIAQLLSSEGFSSIEDVAYVDHAEFSAIDGFDADIAAELQQRAITYLENRQQLLVEKCRTNGMEEELLAIEGLDGVAFDQLAQKDINTRDDLAELSGEELLDIIGKDRYTVESANAIIMAARAHWFA
jgi:N utilization substance protein A